MGNIRIELDRADDPVDALSIDFRMKATSAKVAPAELRASVRRKND